MKTVAAPAPGLAVLLVSLFSLAGCSKVEAAAEPLPASGAAAASVVGAQTTSPLYALTATRLDGRPEVLSAYRGKVLLVVNTASECGFTPQYEGLEALYQELSGRGLVVLGFPSNDFGGQEPGTSEQIASFCRASYKVTFPLFEKLVTKGPDAAPLYKLLTAAAGAPKWNFHKYVVDRRGRVLEGFASAVTPGSPELRAVLDRALAAPP